MSGYCFSSYYWRFLLIRCMSPSLWTKYTVAAIPGSFIFTMIFLPLYQLIAPMAGGASYSPSHLRATT